MTMKDIKMIQEEQGRTMAEMLGVIALIGVLSAGGVIYGDQIVGDIKANRIVSGVQERILLAQRRRIIGQSLLYRERRIQETIAGLYPVVYQKGVSDPNIPIYFGKKITVSEIPYQVCKALKTNDQLKSSLSDIGGIISFNDEGQDGECYKDADNSFFVLFGGREQNKCYGVSNGCTTCDDSTGEWVIDESKEGEQIQDICHECSNGRIVAKEKGRTIPCNGNECCSGFEVCDPDLGCTTRCPEHSSTTYVEGNQIADSDCYCDADYRVNNSHTGCRPEKLCEETCDSKLKCDDGKCVCKNEGEEYVPSITNRENKVCCASELIMNGACCSSVTYDETTGEKLCCGYNSSKNGCCPEGYVAFNGTCYSCDDPESIWMVAGSAQHLACYMCPDRMISGFKCFKTKCPEEDQTEQDGFCYCPDDKPIQDTSGLCHSCDSGKQGVWAKTSLFLKNSGFPSDTCGPAAYCGNYRCNGGYVWSCSAGQIGSFQASSKYNFLLADGSNAAANTCYDCSEVDVSTIKFQSQCGICGGKWSGENWFTGTCTPPLAPQCAMNEDCGENDCIVCDTEIFQCIDACQPVEYLEATGTQYIDTGITITATDNFVANYVVTLEKRSTRGLIGYSPANHGYWGITAKNTYELGSSNTSVSTGEKDTVVFERTLDATGGQTHKLYINGTLASTRTRTTAETGKFGLWAIGAGSYKAAGRMYSFQMELNGSNIFDFVPVISPDGEACMFDNVSQKLFCNAGTGSFKTNKD